MKKNILKLVFASAFALVAGYSVYVSQQETGLSDLALANVEALAQGEDNNRGAANAIMSDLGKYTTCENGVFYSVSTYKIDCVGEGNII